MISAGRSPRFRAFEPDGTPLRGNVRPIDVAGLHVPPCRAVASLCLCAPIGRVWIVGGAFSFLNLTQLDWTDAAFLVANNWALLILGDDRAQVDGLKSAVVDRALDTWPPGVAAIRQLDADLDARFEAAIAR